MEDYTKKSFWLGSSPYTENPALKGEIKVDVAIVGGGFTGIATSYFLKQQAPSLKVAVLESEVVGYGASGRNGGFAMTLFGMTLSLTKLRFGKEKALEAHRYMEKAVDLVKELVTKHNIDCDFEFPGFLRVATTPKFEKRIKHEVELAKSMGIQGIDWIGKEEVRAQVNSPLYLGAWWEPRCGLVNPAKLVRGMMKIVQGMGVSVYDRTPVIEVSRNDKIHVKTPDGSVIADKLVFATNAYSHLIPQLKRKQVPVFTYIVLTEPLEERHFKEIGWKNRQGIEDARDFVHYYRLTKDNRLLMGGRDITFAVGKDMNKDLNDRIFKQLEDDIILTFPVLKGIKITHRWGGPVSIPTDLSPAMGYLGDKRIVYSLGCVGHGVSLTHMNGWTISDLILEKKTERTETFFVNRKVIPWPPEPFRFVFSSAVYSYMKLEDKILDKVYG
ncbi:MAG: NAD(P)/FAD-dependent oxidoreductase [bacterium]